MPIRAFHFWYAVALSVVVPFVSADANRARAEDPAAAKPPLGASPGLSDDLYPPGITDPADYAVRLEQVRSWLATEAESAKEASANGEPMAASCLRVAQWVLNRQLESLLSRWLLGVSTPQDAAAANRLLDDADAWLARAEAAMTTGAEGETPVSALDSPEPYRILAVLKAYAALFRGLFTELDTKENASVPNNFPVQDALAQLRGDIDHEAAAAARLWIACHDWRQGQLDKVLELLPPPMDEASFHSVYGFHAAVLRCRAIARTTGGFEASYALLERLRARTGILPAAGATQIPGKNLIYWTEKRVLADWLERRSQSAPASNTSRPTDAADRGALKEWCTKRIAELDERLLDRHDSSRSELMRLGSAFPDVIDQRHAERWLDEGRYTPATEAAEHGDGGPGESVDPVTE